jgi:hypothetical protein
LWKPSADWQTTVKHRRLPGKTMRADGHSSLKAGIRERIAALTQVTANQPGKPN